MTVEGTHQVTDEPRVVRSVYDAFARGDADAVLALFDEDVEIRQSEAVPWGGTYRGHEEALRFFGILMAHVEARIEIDRLIHAGDTVVENGRTCGRARASGRPFAIEETHVWRVRDGKVVSMYAYVDDAAMLAALAADEGRRVTAEARPRGAARRGR